MGAKRWLWYLPACLWAAFLLRLGSSNIDVPVVPYAFIPWDKVAHLLLYGVLGVLAVLGWRKAGRRPHILLPLMLALSIGVIDELNQRSVATRTADPRDYLADLIAITIAFAILGRSHANEEGE